MLQFLQWLLVWSTSRIATLPSLSPLHAPCWCFPESLPKEPFSLASLSQGLGKYKLRHSLNQRSWTLMTKGPRANTHEWRDQVETVGNWGPPVLTKEWSLVTCSQDNAGLTSTYLWDFQMRPGIYINKWNHIILKRWQLIQYFLIL